MHSFRYWLVAVSLTVVVGLSGSARAIEIPFFGGDGAGASGPGPGTPEWWKKHKKKAEFVPGEGYQVPGYEGYYDSKGRPMNSGVDEVITSLDTSTESAGLLPGLDPKNHIESVKKAVGQGPNEQAATAALERGKQAFQAKQFGRAAGDFKTAAGRWPNSQVESEALFLLGECYYWQDKYDEARDTYNDLVSKHPNTRHLDTLVRRQWRIAQYWEQHHFDYQTRSRLAPNLTDGTRPRFDTIGHAIKTYESIRLNDPTGPWADDAIMATAGIYFRQNRFGDADYHYTLLRQEYPRSEHQFNAHILGLQAKLQKYQGADYDGTALKEAQELLKQIRTQFAGRLTDEEKERLRGAQAEVARASEERELRRAQYYDKTAHYGAARYYYSQIVQKYGSSPVANQARERLAQIGGEPARPEEPMAWLVDLFPESKERSRVNDLPEVGGQPEVRVAETPESPAATTTR